MQVIIKDETNVWAHTYDGMFTALSVYGDQAFVIYYFVVLYASIF